MKQFSDDYYRELEDRLRVLVPEVEAVLSEQLLACMGSSLTQASTA